MTEKDDKICYDDIFKDIDKEPCVYVHLNHQESQISRR